MAQSHPTYDGTDYHGYPIESSELLESYEGAIKRFHDLPTPDDLIRFGLKGLPKVYPLTKEPITREDVEFYLTSAFTELEMQLGMDLAPVERFHSKDYLPDLFSANWGGIKLPRFPATKIVKMSLKFPHSQLAHPIMEYIIPAGWIILRNNFVNLGAAMGSITVENSAMAAGPAGLVTFFSGFARNGYQPALIEIQYVSGWDNGKLPAHIADLILTVATIRMLNDIGPILFPFTSTSVSIDGVGQSAGLPGPQILMGRIAALEKKRAELEAATLAGLGRTIKMATIGAG